MLTAAMMQDEKFWTIESLCNDSSEFARALGKLAMVSDYNNLAIIQGTWPGTWEKHAINGRRMAAAAGHPLPERSSAAASSQG